MKKNIFEKITSFLRASPEQAAAIADRFAAQYDRSTGAAHKAVTADDPVTVAMNLAGLYAALNAALAIASLHVGDPEKDVDIWEEETCRILAAMAAGKLTPTQRVIARLVANATWAAGQPFRGLARLQRPAMCAFPTLSEKEMAKDDDQIVVGAQILLEVIESTDS